MRHPIVLLCAYQPNQRFPALVSELLVEPYATIVVVDDGSTESHQRPFEAIQGEPRVRLLRHARNRGKGAALKTGFRYVNELEEKPTHVVCADADHQHLPADIKKVALECERAPGCAVLGSRVATSEMPLRNRFGNVLTRRLFKLVTGAAVKDSQTGLRGIPVEALPDLIEIAENRYDYELSQLLRLLELKTPIREVEIETVYNADRDSHFDPLVDSYRIYKVLARRLLA